MKVDKNFKIQMTVKARPFYQSSRNLKSNIPKYWFGSIQNLGSCYQILHML